MTLSSDNMMKLMAYADGELEGADRSEAEMLLATEVDALTFIEQIAGLGELVEHGYEAKSGRTIASFDVAGAVMAAIKTSKETPLAKEVGSSSVGSVAAAAAAREKKRNASLKLSVGVVAVLALAASVFVFTQHRGEETPMAVGPAPAFQPAADVPGTGVAVESAGKSVSVFYLPTANELSTSVVVWVDETGEK